jgi:divalent metal cation (Fe/Co/Zn/Cd) transporter
MTEAKNRYRASRRVLFATLWLTLFVLSVKVSAGWTTRSLSLLAESLHTLITSFSILLSLLVTAAPDRLAGREVHGHSKLESVATLLLVAFLGFACLNLLGMSAQQLVAATRVVDLPYPTAVSLPLIQLLGVVVSTTLVLALIGVYQARVLNSPAVRFNSIQLFKDVGLTLLVVAGLVGVMWGIFWLDVMLAVFLVILAARSCWYVVNWQLPLMVQQTAIAPEVLAQIARQVGGVTHCYQIESRGIVGRLVLVQMHLILHPEFMGIASLIAERIELAIRERYGPIQAIFYIDDDVRELENYSSANPTLEVNGIRYRRDETHSQN